MPERQFKCPYCKYVFKVSKAPAVGSKVQCTHCGRLFVAPARSLQETDDPQSFRKHGQP
jgi:predicted Zn finger-like uncharacterized protein